MNFVGLARAWRSPFTRWAVALPVLMCIVVTFFGSLAFKETQQALIGEFYTALREEVVILELIYREDGFNALQSAVALRSNRQETQRVYLLTDAQGRYLAGNLSEWPSTVPVKDESSALFADPETGETIAAEVFLLFGDNRLLVGRRAIYEQVAQHLIQNYLALCAVMLLAALIAGFVFSRLIQRRLNTISQTAHHIRIGNEDSRIPLAGSQDEIDGVIVELNALLDQQHKLLSYARQTSSAIAHDMRQPLSLLRGKLLELSESEHDGPIKHAALEQLEQIQALFSAVLRLGRLESGAQVLRSEMQSLSTIVHDVAELYQPLLEDDGFQIRLSGGEVSKQVDRELLFSALCNLIENVLRYAPGHVDIAISEAGISVRDYGTGVSEDELERLIEPFYKTETSRNSAGHGLGLALVKAITELHGGQLQLSNQNPGFMVSIALP
ncbi:HAMP domain-containing histidine kinase [Chitinibacter sp. SCUT-21]|uniref:sensor histidine kinase n=1 Tax=Chitinibacter sp. SCUT-21 TaxID=2970891 RepID=UPI0035A610CC